MGNSGTLQDEAQVGTTAQQDLSLRNGPASHEIQGNILAGFNKDHQFFIFLGFGDADQARQWLRALLPRLATTYQVAAFNEQFSAARRYRGGDDPENLKAKWINVGLTYHGITTLTPGLASDLGAGAFTAFREGPAAPSRADALRDTGLSAPGTWVVGGPNQQTVDAILTVAADDESDLAVELEKMRTLASQYGVITIYEQRGDTLPDARRGHEHFGFKDGVSQPGVRGFDPSETNAAGEEQKKDHPGTKMIDAGQFILGQGSAAGNGSGSGVPAWMTNGSFQVFRRLRQDVPGWWSQVTQRTLSLPSGDPMKEDLLAAKAVGRWRSGTPLAKAPVRDNRSERDRADDNDFKYDDDPEGLKTPRFAHIRKMYPRNNAVFDDNRRRIMRRGIPFGAAFDPAAGRGHGVDADRGLLFNVFMASIEEQFEFLQQSWANFAQFPGVVVGDEATDGPDPVIGEDPATCLLHREGLPDQQLDFRRFVHTSGAVYAFAPSLSTLRRLTGDMQVGDKARVIQAGGLPLRLRSQPGLAQNTVVDRLPPGTEMDLIGGPQNMDGHTWWHIRTTDGREGWVAGENLEPA